MTSWNNYAWNTSMKLFHISITHHPISITKQITYWFSLTAISLQADMDIPVPSICFSAYSFSSFLHTNKKNIFSKYYFQIQNHDYKNNKNTLVSQWYINILTMHALLTASDNITTTEIRNTKKKFMLQWKH